MNTALCSWATRSNRGLEAAAVAWPVYKKPIIVQRGIVARYYPKSVMEHWWQVWRPGQRLSTTVCIIWSLDIVVFSCTYKEHQISLAFKVYFQQKRKNDIKIAVLHRPYVCIVIFWRGVRTTSTIVPRRLH